MAYPGFDLGGKVGLVTGGNSGIGLGMAAALAQAGAAVAIWGTSAEKNRNAGVGGRSAGQGFVDMTTAEWRRVLEVNLDGAFFTLRAAARHMVSRPGGGSLVVTASLAAISGQARGEHYAASKAG